MEKKNTITIRLSDEQYGWLRALSRRSKRSQSEVVRSLIEQGTVRERITRENLDIIRKLIGESTNLNQLAKQANRQGFFRVRDECQATALNISQLLKRITDDRYNYKRNIVRRVRELCTKRRKIAPVGGCRSRGLTLGNGRAI